MTERNIYLWIAMSGVTPKKSAILIKEFGGVVKLFDAVRTKRIPLLDKDYFKDINKLSAVTDEMVDKRLDSLLDKGITLITPACASYPKELTLIQEPPNILLALGNLDLLQTRKIAIVGTRRCSEYGAKCAGRFGKELAAAGVTVVSGLAEGVDAVAHKSALDAEGNTIAVLGGGFDRFYPASNYNLFRTIVAKGLVLTEYFPDENPTKYTFPLRNRIVSAISEGVLIVEGGKGSGSLITAECALDQHKELYVVPGRIDTPTSEGSNKLIAAMQGSIVLSPEDILNRMRIKAISQVADKITLDSCEEMVYNFLRINGRAHLNELCAHTKLSVIELNCVLFSLEEKQLVSKGYGNIYTLK